MKRLLFVLCTLAPAFYFTQNVSINATGAAPVVSAMLDISSTTSGLLIPRMTSVQRTAIITPATGLKVYDTTTGSFWYFNGVIWVQVLNANTGWALAGNTLAGTEILGSVNAQPVRFFSNNVERARIVATGEFVVGGITAFAADVFSSYASGTDWAINGYSSGSGAGLYGQNTATGNGLQAIASSATAFGIRGSNSNASGTGELIIGNGVAGSYLIAGSGAAVTGSTTGIWGRTTAAGGTGGIFSGNASGATNLTGGSGLSAVGTNFGVAGFSSSTATGVTRAGGYFTTGSGQSYAYVGARTATNILRKIEGNGTVNTVVTDLNNNQVVLSCPEAPENLFQDFGQGELINGKAHIDLDPVFAKNIIVNEKHPLRVFIQLKGDCNGVYVTNETGTGFDVHELKGGTSQVKFSYFITANRADEKLPDGTISSYSSERFAPAMGPQATTNMETITVPSEDTKTSDK